MEAPFQSGWKHSAGAERCPHPALPASHKTKRVKTALQDLSGMAQEYGITQQVKPDHAQVALYLHQADPRAATAPRGSGVGTCSSSRTPSHQHTAPLETCHLSLAFCSVPKLFSFRSGQLRCAACGPAGGPAFLLQNDHAEDGRGSELPAAQHSRSSEERGFQQGLSLTLLDLISSTPAAAIRSSAGALQSQHGNIIVLEQRAAALYGYRALIYYSLSPNSDPRLHSSHFFY